MAIWTMISGALDDQERMVDQDTTKDDDDDCLFIRKQNIMPQACDTKVCTYFHISCNISQEATRRTFYRLVHGVEGSLIKTNEKEKQVMSRVPCIASIYK
jgi:hypothetical protein